MKHKNTSLKAHHVSDPSAVRQIWREAEIPTLRD